MKSRFNLWSWLGLATKYDLKKLERHIMATQLELIEALKTVRAQQDKSTEEIKNALKTLSDKITELEEVIAKGEATPELTAAVDAVKAQAQVIDDLIPDLPPPPPVS